jgi:hypothetical protein
VINLSNNAANSVSPFLLVRNNTIFVAWADEANKSSIILWNGDNSATGIKKELDSRYAEFSSSPLIFDTKDKVWISWTEYYNHKHRIVLIEP